MDSSNSNDKQDAPQIDTNAATNEAQEKKSLTNSNQITIFTLFGLVILLIWILLTKKDSDQHLKDVIIGHTRAVEREDLLGSQKFLHPESNYFSPKAKLIAQRLFNSTDIDYTIEKIAVDYSNEFEAKLTVVLVTEGKMTDGSRFRNNRMTQTVTLRKSQEQWLIWKTEVSKIDFLN